MFHQGRCRNMTPGPPDSVPLSGQAFRLNGVAGFSKNNLGPRPIAAETTSQKNLNVPQGLGCFTTRSGNNQRRLKSADQVLNCSLRSFSSSRATKNNTEELSVLSHKTYRMPSGTHVGRKIPHHPNHTNGVYGTQKSSRQESIPREISDVSLELESGKNASMSRTRVQCFKTKMCHFYLQQKCSRGVNCVFAHSPEELRLTPDLSKTKICVKWKKGLCFADSSKCSYAHGVEELRFCVDLSDAIDEDRENQSNLIGIPTIGVESSNQMLNFVRCSHPPLPYQVTHSYPTTTGPPATYSTAPYNTLATPITSQLSPMQQLSHCPHPNIFAQRNDLQSCGLPYNPRIESQAPQPAQPSYQATYTTMATFAEQPLPAVEREANTIPVTSTKVSPISCVSIETPHRNEDVGYIPPLLPGAKTQADCENRIMEQSVQEHCNVVSYQNDSIKLVEPSLPSSPSNNNSVPIDSLQDQYSSKCLSVQSCGPSQTSKTNRLKYCQLNCSTYQPQDDFHHIHQYTSNPPQQPSLSYIRHSSEVSIRNDSISLPIHSLSNNNTMASISINTGCSPQPFGKYIPTQIPADHSSSENSNTSFSLPPTTAHGIQQIPPLTPVASSPLTQTPSTSQIPGSVTTSVPSLPSPIPGPLVIQVPQSSSSSSPACTSPLSHYIFHNGYLVPLVFASSPLQSTSAPSHHVTFPPIPAAYPSIAMIPPSTPLTSKPSMLPPPHHVSASAIREQPRTSGFIDTSEY